MTKSLAILIVLLLAALGMQRAHVQRLEVEKGDVVAAFATYRATAERQAREASEREAKAAELITQRRQEAIDADHKDRLALQVAADRLRGSNGQLQRYVTDLSTSLSDRAADSASTGGCAPATATLDLSAQLLGQVDDAAADLAVYADQVRAAHQLCVATFNALSLPPR